MSHLKAAMVVVAGFAICALLGWVGLLASHRWIIGGVTDAEREETYSGRIVALSDGPACFKILTVVSDADTVRPSVCQCGSEGDFLGYLEVGDLVTKVRDSLVVFVTRPSHRGTIRFDYPVCNH